MNKLLIIISIAACFIMSDCGDDEPKDRSELIAAGYISIEKGFAGRKTRTIARITTEGRNAFEEYVEALKQYISMQ